MLKKYFAILLSIAMLSGLNRENVAAQSAFKDVSNKYWASAQINYLNEHRIISGYPDGTFKPNNQVTRAQAAKMLVRALKLSTSNRPAPQFKDISTGHQAYIDIATVADEGLMVGTTGMFRPNETLTRAQMARILSKAFKLTEVSSYKDYKDVSKKYWAYKDIKLITSNQISMGYTDGTFRPSEPTTRAQFSVALAIALFPELFQPKDQEKVAGVATAREMFIYAEALANSADLKARFVGARMIETDNPERFIAQYTMDNPEMLKVNPDTADSYQLNDAVILKLIEQTNGDQNVGDGYAEKCAFYFETSSGLQAVVVKADGTIVYNRTIQASGKGYGELKWSIDTKDASNLFATANANFNQLRGHSHVLVWDLTKKDHDNAYWLGGLLRASSTQALDGKPRLNGEAPDYCELGDFKIDAMTGTILSNGMLHTPTSGKQGATHCD